MMQKMMTRRTLKMLIYLAIVDSIVILISIIFFDIKILWSTQFAFMSASFILLASMKSYQRMIDARIALDLVTIDDSKDIIDQLEDPYDLYSEDVVEVPSGDFLLNSGQKPLVEVVKEERKKLKSNGRSTAQTLKDARAALSFYRIGAYIFLILGFLYLNRNELLHVPSYILALSIPVLVVVYILITHKEDLQ